MIKQGDKGAEREILSRMGNCLSASNNQVQDEETLAERKGVWTRIENILGSEFEDITQYYAVGKVIGKGRFGLIREVACLETHQVFACKSILKNNLKSSSQVSAVRREVAVMDHLKGNEHIIDLEDVFEDKEYIHIIMELCTGDDLFKSVSAVNHYSERDAADAIKSVLEIVEHMHSRNVVHRDIRPQNFLFSKKGEGAKVKAIHFGCSAFYSGHESFADFFGGAQYVAPEVINGAYSYKADLWSCGVILFILLSGTSPFRGANQQETCCRVLRGRPDYTGKAWRYISSGAKKCLKKMLQMNPNKRPTAEEVLQDQWLVENGTASSNPLHNAVFRRFKSFAAMNTLKKESLRLIAYNMPEHEIKDLLRIFYDLDADRDGVITMQELQRGLGRLESALPESDLQSIMDAVDVDQDGVIDYEEFVNTTIRMARSKKEDTLQETFKYFDIDGNGYITKNELLTVLGGRPDADKVGDIMTRVDTDKDGKISFAEYSTMMLQDDDFVD